MSRNLKIILLLKLILWLIIFYAGYNIYTWIKDTYNNNKIIENINKITTQDNNSILNINEDIKGWIKVDKTNINYPFVQTNDNDYYLKHSIDKSKNKAGWIFLDYRNNINDLDHNTIFYGHNRIDNTMFGSLKNLLKNNNINNIYITTDKYNSIWEIFSIYHINKTNDYLNINIDNNYVELITNRSIYNYNNKPDENDYLITLSTCYNNNERLVVHGKLIMKEGIINEE